MKKQKEIFQDFAQENAMKMANKLAETVNDQIKSIFPVWQQRLIESHPKLLKIFGIGLKIEQKIFFTPMVLGHREYTIKRFGKVIKRFSTKFVIADLKKKEVKKE